MNSKKLGFDNATYIEQQSAEIMKRAERFGKLYLEVGGKLFQDLHAARVLPGFDPDVKIKMLQKLGDRVEVIVCIYSGDIEHRKYRADFGTTYDNEVLRLIDEVRSYNINVSTVVMTRYNSKMKGARGFANKLKKVGLKVVFHSVTPGYPDDIETILSEDGCGKNPYIQTERSVVAVIAPGPMSGKFATCLNQLYHDNKAGIHSGYAKLETFPVWNLSLEHPVNIAYEAATADLLDENLIDTFHEKAYGIKAVNYNRDIEAFPILHELLMRVSGEEMYKSPTDMGVNRVGFAINNNDLVCKAARKEILRRHLRTICDVMIGRAEESTLEKTQSLVNKLSITEAELPVIEAARQGAIEATKLPNKGNQGIYCAAAIQLKDGTIIVGKNTELLHAASAMILNALKYLAGIPDWLHLLPANYIKSIHTMKSSSFARSSLSLDASELLVALGICAANSNAAERAIEKLPELNGCEVHLTHMMGSGDAEGLRKIGVRATTDPFYPTKKLFVQ